MSEPDAAADAGEDAPPEPSHLFRLDVTEVSVVTLEGDPPDHLIIESWHEGRGITRQRR